MKKIHLTILLTGLLALSMIGLSACDDMTGVSDKTANQSISSQAVQGVVNAEGVTEYGVAGVFIDEIEDKTYTGSEIDVYIKGYVGFKSASSGGNHPRLTEFHLTYSFGGVDDLPINSWSASNLDHVFLINYDNNPGREFDDEAFGDYFNKLTITEKGTYVVTARAVFTQEGTYSPKFGYESFEVIEETELDVEFPAAPAIAARILEANEVAPRYGSGRTGGNYISDVARFMSPGTDFYDGVVLQPKANVDGTMNKAYWDAVWNFLRSATGEDLNEAPQGYIW